MASASGMRCAPVYVAGHGGMVGSAIVRRLEACGYTNVIVAERNYLDLTVQANVQEFFADRRIKHVYLAAAKVGGIYANSTYPGEFIYQNLMIEANVIHAAHLHGVDRLLFLGSSCIYPKYAEQPIPESALLSGNLESTNEPYAVAKIAGIKLCEAYNKQYGHDFRSLMPTNLYGPNDNFHPLNSHVIPALIRRFHEAKVSGLEEVCIWGSGTPLREFLHVDDLADACVHVMELEAEKYNHGVSASGSHVNVGTGSECSIGDLAKMVARVVGYHGRLLFDKSKPDGTPRKLLDVSHLKRLGWRASIPLEAGLKDTYRWFVEHVDRVRA